MKAKVAIIVLVLACVALGIALVDQQKKADKRAADDKTQFDNVTSQFKATSAQKEELQQVYYTLNTNLNKSEAEVKDLTARLTETRTQLEASQSLAQNNGQLARSNAEAAATFHADLDKSVAEANALKEQVQRLTTEQEGLNKQMADMTNTLVNLEGQIADTQKKLANSEGEREFLLKQLAQLQTQKAELEKQLNDLDYLRTQVRKLRDELAISKRLDWIRRGLYGEMKGAERTMALANAPFQPKGSNYDLNVELKDNGGARILPATNAPATNSAPEK